MCGVRLPGNSGCSSSRHCCYCYLCRREGACWCPRVTLLLQAATAGGCCHRCCRCTALSPDRRDLTGPYHRQPHLHGTHVDAMQVSPDGDGGADSRHQSAIYLKRWYGATSNPWSWQVNQRKADTAMHQDSSREHVGLRSESALLGLAFCRKHLSLLPDIPYPAKVHG